MAELTPVKIGVEASTSRATGWLLHSGILDVSGGCHAWFDVHRGYQALYPEVTGYFLTFAEWVGDRTGDEAARTAAARTAGWLTRLLDPAGGFPCLVHTARSAGLDPSATDKHFVGKADRHYTFDAGIVLQGLTAFSQRTGSAQVRHGARALGDWLLDQQNGDGTFTPFTGAPDWGAVAADWSTRPGCHQSKVALGLLALSELEGKPAYADAAIRAVHASLAFQQADGRFVTNLSTGSTNVHPHSYAAEACWAVGTATGDRSLVEAAARATRFLLDRSDRGSVLRTFAPGPAGGRTSAPMRIDGLAQTLRLAVLTGAGTDKQCDALAATLLTHQQWDDDDQHTDGGFRFGFTSAGDPLPHVNVWVTAFAVQALVLYSEGNDLDWRYLV